MLEIRCQLGIVSALKTRTYFPSNAMSRLDHEKTQPTGVCSRGRRGDASPRMQHADAGRPSS